MFKKAFRSFVEGLLERNCTLLSIHQGSEDIIDKDVCDICEAAILVDAVFHYCSFHRSGDFDTCEPCHQLRDGIWIAGTNWNEHTIGFSSLADRFNLKLTQYSEECDM
jgi:hypothetical protein